MTISVNVHNCKKIDASIMDCEGKITWVDFTFTQRNGESFKVAACFNTADMALGHSYATAINGVATAAASQSASLADAATINLPAISSASQHDS